MAQPEDVWSLVRLGALAPSEAAALAATGPAVCAPSGTLKGSGGGAELMVYVRLPEGDTREVTVSAEGSVADLLAAAAAAFDVPVQGCTLSLHGERLPTDQLCADAGLASEAVIELRPCLMWKLVPMVNQGVTAQITEDGFGFPTAETAGWQFVGDQELSGEHQWEFVADGTGYLYWVVVPSKEKPEDTPGAYAHNGNFYGWSTNNYGWDTAQRSFYGGSGKNNAGVIAVDLSEGGRWLLRVQCRLDAQAGFLQCRASAQVRNSREVHTGQGVVSLPPDKTWRPAFLCGSAAIRLHLGGVGDVSDIEAPEIPPSLGWLKPGDPVPDVVRSQRLAVPDRDSSDSSDHDGVAPSPQDWTAQKAELAEMGFTDDATNETLLVRHGGNIERVVAALLGD